jgi:serine/threonine-protein kinase
LEDFAADKSYWTEAATHLVDDMLDREFESSSAAMFESAPADHRDERPELLRITDYFDPTDDPRMLGRFGGYEIAGVVGSGGMGVVLKGFEPALDRSVAIKVLEMSCRFIAWRKRTACHFWSCGTRRAIRS